MVFLESTSKAMADREKNRGRWIYKNLEKEKSFLDEINIFHSFEGLSFGEKYKFNRK